MNPRAVTAVRRHSLGWLVAANLAGLWLAVLLLWPGLNDLLAPLTYGRWVPLHLDWQLYGWCALPLVGLLFHYYLPEDDRAAFAARLSLAIWSLALLAGGLSWLAGGVGGKLFLDWAGPGSRGGRAAPCSRSASCRSCFSGRRARTLIRRLIPTPAARRGRACWGPRLAWSGSSV